MRINNHPAFGNGLKEVIFGQKAIVIEIKEFKCLEKNCINADFGRSFKLKFILEFDFESRFIGMRYALMEGSDIFKYLSDIDFYYNSNQLPIIHNTTS